MDIAELMKSLIKLTPHLSILVLSLLWTYLTIGIKVRKTRRAFEKQLIKQGMSIEDAKRLSAGYQELKDNLSNAVKQSILGRFSSAAS